MGKRPRIERDSMGTMEVPADAYWGASTQRAVLNFPISGRRIPTPMKLKPAVSRTAQAMKSVNWTRIGESVFGTRCERMIRHDDVPTAFEAVT